MTGAGRNNLKQAVCYKQRHSHKPRNTTENNAAEP